MSQATTDAVLAARGWNLWYNGRHVLRDVDLVVPRYGVLALIGPSGSGKSSLLRSFNRMNDFVGGTSHRGTILLDGQDIYAPTADPVALRQRVGMVFQRPNPFPMSIFDNVAYGPRLRGRINGRELRELVAASLEQAALWDEVRHRLHAPALSLSGGQQQRLCIARALAVKPEVLLMDEPASALDPASTARIEDLMRRLAATYTIVVVTHNMQQAARVADRAAFLLEGTLVEVDTADRLFTAPRDPRTEAYVTGRFG